VVKIEGSAKHKIRVDGRSILRNAGRRSIGNAP